MKKLTKTILGIVTLAALSLITSQATHATVVPETCYDFSAGVIGNYDINNPACTSDPEIPTTIGGEVVTQLGNYSFQTKGLTSVTIPMSVISIGEGAFNNNQLTSVTIPSSITSLEPGVFETNQLTSVTIPSSVTSIGEYAFRHNQLTSITIPSLVTTIGVGAFQDNKLTSITIPDLITNIAASTFAFNRLTSVKFPDSVTSIGDDAFTVNNLASLDLPSSLTNIGNTAFSLNSLTSVTIPNSVTSIQLTAFMVQTPYGADGLGMVQDPTQAPTLYNSIWYAQLYTVDSSNPNNLTDAIVAESIIGGDINGDGDQTDAFGGHLINPAQVNLLYENSAGDTLSPSTTITGTNLTSYQVIENPTHDASLYYRLGQTQNFSAPAISGYSTPASISLQLDNPTTSYIFVYAGTSGTTASLLASTGNSIVIILMYVLGLTVLSSISLYTIRSQRRF